MAIDETLSGSGISAETNPTNGVSDVVIGGGNGNVFLEQQATSTSEWVVIAENKRGAFSVNTPDTDISYRIRTTNETEDVPVYFGP